MANVVTLPRYITQTQLCEMLQISKWTVQRWEKAGKIHRHVFNGAVRYKVSEVMALDNAEE